VREQVDRDLTIVSWVDRLLGLIKNLGRYKYSLCLGDQLTEAKRKICAFHSSTNSAST
jgi:hypothetical protein